MAKILLVAAGKLMAYKVLRCAAEIAESVFVLGDEPASRLASSRYCTSFVLCPHAMQLERGDEVAAEINRLVAEHGISCVVPGDYQSTRLLAGIGNRLQARLYPLPSRQLLEDLNDKWRFYRLCRELAVPVPESALVADKRELASRMAAYPNGQSCVVKPLDREGGDGFLDLRRSKARDRVPKIDYQPILMQDFIAGRDICIALLCSEGEVRASVVYLPSDCSIQFTRHDVFEQSARRIASHCRYTGVICFDGRLSPSGEVSFLECNPRFWNNIDIAMIGGVNFVALGLADSSPAACATIDSGLTLRSNATTLPGVLRPWLYSKNDLRFLLYRLRDFRFMLSLRRWNSKGGAKEQSAGNEN